MAPGLVTTGGDGGDADGTGDAVDMALSSRARPEAAGARSGTVGGRTRGTGGGRLEAGGVAGPCAYPGHRSRPRGHLARGRARCCWQVFGLAGTRTPAGSARGSHLLSAASQVHRLASACPVLLAEVVPAYRCGGSPGFTPDSLLASDLDDRTTSYRATISSELHRCRVLDVVFRSPNLWTRQCATCGQPASPVDAERRCLWTAVALQVWTGPPKSLARRACHRRPESRSDRQLTRPADTRLDGIDSTRSARPGSNASHQCTRVL